MHAIIGTDEGRVKEEALRLHRELTGGVDDGFTHETIDGTADHSEGAFQICRAVVEALNTLPFFGGEKVVWLKSATFLVDDVTGRSERTLDGVESLRACLDRGLAPGVTFLLSATGIDKRRAFWKFLEKSASVRSFDKIDTSKDGWEEEVALLVRGRARDLGLSFEEEALELFVMQAGEATRQIGSELEKLDLFLGPERRVVSLEDVRLLVPMSRAGIVFEIGKSLQTGDAARAIELIDRLLVSGESAIGLMRASMIPTVRSLFMARVVADMGIRGSSYPAFAAALDKLPPLKKAWLPQKKAGGVNAYPLFLSQQAARAFSQSALRSLMESALKADKALVTTGLDHRLVLHRFVAEMSAAVERR
ncbi:DNA polymerase-3 subunit delta [Haloferula luteola]|uniref:DNA polymerase-3 subunit delta n=1 Tax=Haloferula luteola TaxID=595692 RepID=A0A840VAD2_9BACT|nr:DNA polymerase III subunit delta [Haloferula luteola]MBB5352514.1 DNA polymerase-3 subunit delta [Haloferula luteola]